MADKKKDEVQDVQKDEQAVVEEQVIRPPLRNLVIETDGDVLFVRSCTMGLIELSRCLQMLAVQVDAEQKQKSAPRPPAQPAAPAEQPAPEETPEAETPKDAQPADEAKPTPEEQKDA